VHGARGVDSNGRAEFREEREHAATEGVEQHAKARCEVSETNTIEVTVGEFLFEFRSYLQWVNKASSWFVNLGSHSRRQNVICIDAKGRICRTGRDFMRADREKAFPVKAYEAALASEEGGDE
jgi:hypothetical protein